MQSLVQLLTSAAPQVFPDRSSPTAVSNNFLDFKRSFFRPRYFSLRSRCKIPSFLRLAHHQPHDPPPSGWPPPCGGNLYSSISFELSRESRKLPSLTRAAPLISPLLCPCFFKAAILSMVVCFPPPHHRPSPFLPCAFPLQRTPLSALVLLSVAPNVQIHSPLPLSSNRRVLSLSGTPFFH